MAVTRIKNNQITDATIFANVKIAPGTIVGSLFNPDVTINSNIAIVGNLTVTGNTNTINSTNTLVNDPLVIFNNGYVGTPSYDVGILIDRNLQPLSPTNYGSLNTAWVWREADGSFEGLLTTETGITQGAINRSAYANLIIGNTTIKTTATDPSVVEAVDTATGALQVKGGASFTQNIQVGGVGSVFGSNTGVAAIQGNTAVLQITQLNSTRPGLMITDTNNNGALTLTTGVFGASIQTYGGTNKDIYIQPNNQPSLILQAGNGAVIGTAGINSTNANIGAIIVSGSGGVGIGGNLNTGTSASFESQNVYIQSNKTNDVVIGKNQLKTGIAANVTALGATQGITSIGENTTVVGMGAGAGAPGANSTLVGKGSGNIVSGTNNQFFGYNSGSLVTTGSKNLIIGAHDGNTIATLSNYSIIADGEGNPRINIDNTGNVWIVATNDSTSPTTGALTVNGGVGIRGNVNIGANSISINTLVWGGNADTAGGKVYAGYAAYTEAISGNSVVIGVRAGNNGTGIRSTIVGDNAGRERPADNSTLIGHWAGRGVTGQNSTMVGQDAGRFVTAADNNQFFGYTAGRDVITGAYNVILGANTGSTISSLSNRIIIADGAGTSRINITDTGSTEITSTVETDSIGTGALIVDGGLSVYKNTRIGGNLTVTGNLNVIGNISTINSNFLTVVDPIIELGLSANAGGLTTNDGKDRGLRLHYYTNADRSNFLGWQNSTGNLVYLQNAIESGANVFTGTYGSVQFGQMKLSNTNPSTSQTSGALQVVGGVGIEGRLTANNAVIDNNLTASGSGAIITFAPTGSGYVTINPETTGTIDNMTIGGSTPVQATFTNVIITNTLTISGSGSGNISPSGNLILQPVLPGDMNNIYIGNITPRQASFTAANIGQDLVMKAFSANSVLFISPSGNLSVDQDNLDFNFQRQTGNTFSSVGLHVGTNGDFGGTDTLNIYYQGDAYLPQNAISANTLGQIPGWTVSTSRGSTHSPTNSVDGDLVGTFGAYAYTGTGDFKEISGIRTVVSGATNSINGIGGEMQLWTKRDNSAHSLALRIDNNQKGTFYGQVAIANSTISTTTSSGAFYVQGGTAIGGNLNVSQGARFNDEQNHNRDFYVRGGNDATLVWASTSSLYNQVLIGNSAVSANLVTGAKLQINSTDAMLIPKGTEAQRPGNSGYGTPVAGMIRFNTVAGDLEYYDGGKWFQPQAGATTTIIAETFTGDGLTTEFFLSGNCTTAGAFIAINGTLQQPVVAYSITGTKITFTEAPAPGDVISVRELNLSVSAGLTSTQGLVTLAAIDEGVFITGANGSISANSVLFKHDGTVGWNGTPQIVVNTSPVLIHTFDAGRYRSAKYVVQVENDDIGAYEVSDIMVIHNGTYAYRTQYNMISTFPNAAPLGSITTAYTSGNVNLYYQGITTGNRVKVRADMISNDQPWQPY
jgi:acyl dehydratase